METLIPFRFWFIFHFAVDWLVGLPLIIAPAYIANLIGWQPFDPVGARFIGAALIAIGGVSLTEHRSDLSVILSLLRLKILWSAAVIGGLILSIIQGAPWAANIILIIFASFLFVWLYYYGKFINIK